MTIAHTLSLHRSVAPTPVALIDGVAQSIAAERAPGDGPLQAAYLLARIVGLLDGVRPDSPDIFVPLKDMTDDAVRRVADLVSALDRAGSLGEARACAPGRTRPCTDDPERAGADAALLIEGASGDGRGVTRLKLAVSELAPDAAAFRARVHTLRLSLMGAIEICLLDSLRETAPV